MVELDGGETDPLQIAAKELRERKIPMIVRRFLPDGDYEDWSMDELLVWKIQRRHKIIIITTITTHTEMKMKINIHFSIHLFQQNCILFQQVVNLLLRFLQFLFSFQQQLLLWWNRHNNLMTNKQTTKSELTFSFEVSFESILNVLIWTSTSSIIFNTSNQIN